MGPDREVRDPLLDRILEQGPVPELLQPDRDVRVLLVPRPDVPRQQPDRHRQDGRDLELAGLERERRAGGAAAALDRAQGRAGLGQQRAPGRGQRRSVRETRHHRAVQLLLERPDVL